MNKLFLLCTLIFANVNLSNAAIIYVKKNAIGFNNGTSWANAFTNLNTALTNASIDDQIWVAAATYYPTSTTDRSIAFEMIASCNLYGGFVGTETLLSQRNPIVNQTILSGDIGVIGNDNDNSYHVLVIAGQNSSAELTIEGFTITKGIANDFNTKNYNGVNCQQNYGGGIFCKLSTTKIKINNCNVLSNYCNFNGGGIYANEVICEINNSTFSENGCGDYGGALHTYCFGGSQNITINNSVFSKNTSSNFGGAIFFGGNNNNEIINCTFQGNSIPGINDRGGAIRNDNGSHLNIKNTVFFNNAIFNTNTTGLGSDISNSGSVSNLSISFSSIQTNLPCTSCLAINTNPLFSNEADPNGTDNIWRTADDGLKNLCYSPVYNAGTSLGASLKDITGFTRVGNPELGAYEIQILPGVVTSTTPNLSCGTGVLTLGATANAGILNWYASSTGGAILGTGNSFNTPTLSSTTTYYVDATNSGCTSLRSPVTATIITTPTVTSTSPASRCDTGTVILGATASAGTLNWYDNPFFGSSLGTGTSFITPIISANTNYYVGVTTSGCSSSRSAVLATVNTTPTVSSTTPNSHCDAGTVSLGATASAGTLNWYAASTGGTSLGTGTSFTTPSVFVTTTYYVDATNLACTSARSAVTASILASSSSNSSQVAFQSYTWFGTTYSNSGNPTHLLTNIVGCDSTLTLNLTITFIAGDLDGNGLINGTEVSGDTNMDGSISAPEIAGDANGDGLITNPEIAGDVNGDGTIGSGEVAGDVNGDGLISAPEIAGDVNGDGTIGSGEVAGDVNGDGLISAPEITGDVNGDGTIGSGEVAGDVNGDGLISAPEIAGDVNGDGTIGSGEVAGDMNGDGLITNPEIEGDVNGDGTIGSGEVAGDMNGDGLITNPEIAGDVNGDGTIGSGEVAGDVNGDGLISAPEIAGDVNGDGTIGSGEVAGDVNGDGLITNPEIAGDVNGDGTIGSGEVAGDVNGDGLISAPEIAGDVNGDGTIGSGEVAGDVNGDGLISAPEIAGDVNGDGTIGSGEVAGDVNGDGVITNPEIVGDANNNGIAGDCEDLTLLNTPLNISTSSNSTTITADASGVGITYQWINCSGNTLIPNETNQSFTATSNGQYAVIISNGACEDTSTCVIISDAGLNETDLSNSISLFPNPASDFVTINSQNSIQNIKLYGNDGRLIQEVISNGQFIFSLDLHGISSGSYFIEINQKIFQLIKN